MPRSQRGYLLITVVVMLFLLATVAVLLTHDSAISANSASSELEAARADYVGEAGMQHALWRAGNNACMGDMSIPATALGSDSYDATVTGAAAGTFYSLTADQDAWIRSDQPTTNKGGDSNLHIKDSQVEQPLYRFDLSSLPAGAQINYAAASFYVSGEHPEGPVTVHRITAGWNEGDVTWDSISGNIDSGILATIPAQPEKDVRVQVNITGQVQAWVNGEPNNGILLASTAPGIHAQYVSREGAAGEHPRLEVVVGSGPASPVNIQATGTLADGNTRSLKRLAHPALQPPGTYAFQPDATDGIDAYIWEAEKTTNKGTDDETWVSRTSNNASLSLFKFNMGAIPMNSKIHSAILSLHNRSGNNSNVPVTAHRITNPWNEDFVTWNNRDSGTAWRTAGGDIDPAVIASTNVGPTRSIRYEWDITRLAQGWTNGTYANYGVALATAMASSVGERFDTSDHTDPTRRPSLTITYACECGSTCMAPQGSGNVLMVIGDWPGNPAVVDRDIRSNFESWGYTVNLIQDDDSQGNFNAALASNDVVYISDTVSSNNIGLKLTAATIGIVSQKGNHNLELEIASGQAQVVGTTVNVTDPSHYITQPFAGTVLPIYSADMEMITMPATVAAGVQTLTDNAGVGGLVVMDTGSTDLSGNPIAGRRVVLPLGRDQNFNWKYLNGNGRLMVQRSLAWATGAGKIHTGDLLLVVGDASNPATKDADRRDLFESWGYTVTLIDDGADQASFNTETAANDVVYVTDSIADGTLDDKLTDSAIGIVSENAGKLDNFGFGSQVPPNTVTANVFTTTDAAHYISEPFAGAGVTQFTANLTMPVASGTLAPGMQAPGLIGAQEMLATLDAVAERWDSAPSAGRRVHLPFGPAQTDELTPDGETLMLRSIEWAAAVGPSFGPIAHWKLDETSGLTAVDSEGGHDGTLVNGPIWGSGALGGGLVLDGTDDHIIVPHDDNLSFSDFTITAWTYSTDVSQMDPIVLKTSLAEMNYFLARHDDEVQCGFNNSADAVAETTGLNITTNQWYHIACTHDDSSNEIKIYVDGALIETAIATEDPLTNTGPIWLGDLQGVRHWDGTLDDIRLYNRALAADEVFALAQRPPIAHWKLDDGTGSTALDSIGGHHGTLANAPTWMAGHLGDALYFDSVDDYVDLTSDPELDDRFVGGATAMAWIFPRGWGENGYGRILDKSSSASSTGDGWVIRMNKDNGGIINFGQGFSGGRGWWKIPNGSIALETWQHIAVAYDASLTTNDPEIYLNGAPLTVTRVDSPSGSVRSDAAINLRMGNFAGGTSHTFGGMIDDVRIYDRILGPGDIADIAGGGGGSGGGGGGGGASYVELYESWSATSTSTWQSVDLSGYGVPANAVVEVSIENSTDNQEREVGVRAVGSVLGRTFDLHEAEAGGMDAIVLHTQADDGSRIEHFTDNTGAIIFRLLGYWTGAAYVEHQGFFTASASGSWQTHNLASFGIAPGHVVEMVPQNTGSSTERQAGVRKTGSGLARMVDLHESESGGKDYHSVFVETSADASASVEVYAENNGDIEFKVPGAWSTPPGTYREAFVDLGSATSDSTWQTVDLSAHGVPGNAVVQIAMANRSTASDNRQGVRAVGSSADRRIDLHEAEGGGEDLVTMHVNADGSSQIQWYHEDVSDPHAFYLLGWWVLN